MASLGGLPTNCTTKVPKRLSNDFCHLKGGFKLGPASAASWPGAVVTTVCVASGKSVGPSMNPAAVLSLEISYLVPMHDGYAEGTRGGKGSGAACLQDRRCYPRMDIWGEVTRFAYFFWKIGSKFARARRKRDTVEKQMDCGGDWI